MGELKKSDEWKVWWCGTAVGLLLGATIVGAIQKVRYEEKLALVVRQYRSGVSHLAGQSETKPVLHEPIEASDEAKRGIREAADRQLVGGLGSTKVGIGIAPKEERTAGGWAMSLFGYLMATAVGSFVVVVVSLGFHGHCTIKILSAQTKRQSGPNELAAHVVKVRHIWWNWIRFGRTVTYLIDNTNSHSITTWYRYPDLKPLDASGEAPFMGRSWRQVFLTFVENMQKEATTVTSRKKARGVFEELGLVQKQNSADIVASKAEKHRSGWLKTVQRITAVNKER